MTSEIIAFTVGLIGPSYMLYHYRKAMFCYRDALKSADERCAFWKAQYFEKARQIEMRDSLDVSLLNRRRLRAKRSDAAKLGWRTRGAA